MNKIGKNALAASLAFALGGTASAQGPANTQHDGHHAGAPAGAPQSQGSGMLGAGTAAPGGMMGGDMGRMMQQMMQRRMAAAAMQPFRRIEGQLAFFRAELRLTDAQLPQWNSFGDVVRAQAERLRQATQQGMSDGMGAVPAPQQLERRITALSAHLEAMREVAGAAGPLYASLSEEQRRTADELMAEHLRGMRMGIP